MLFSDRLVALRKANGYTQAMLAEQLGVTQRAITEIELGRNKTSADRLCKIADIFHVSVDYLLGRTDDPELHHLGSEKS